MEYLCFAFINICIYTHIHTHTHPHTHIYIYIYICIYIYIHIYDPDFPGVSWSFETSEGMEQIHNTGTEQTLNEDLPALTHKYDNDTCLSLQT